MRRVHQANNGVVGFAGEELRFDELRARFAVRGCNRHDRRIKSRCFLGISRNIHPDQSVLFPARIIPHMNAADIELLILQHGGNA